MSVRRPLPRTRAALISLIALVCAAALAACGSDDGGGSTVANSPSFSAGTTMARLAGAGRITIGTKYDQPGFGLQGLDGRPTGFDVEVGRLVAAALAIPSDRITWVETPSKVREERIQQGKVDLVVATYTINDKRKERVGFAGPYYVAGQDIMVGKGDATITGPESLRSDPSAKICSVTGSTPAENIKQYLANPAQLVLFDVYSKCADALRTGQVKAVTTDNVILLGLVAKSNGAFELVGKPFTEEPYGIGIRKGDTAFCEFIDSTLKKAADSGDYEKAWKATAGRIEGAQTPTLPAPDPCT